jgi:Tol biopolymer transport system component
MIAELFAPEILSTDANEFNAAFTPEGDAVYFTGEREQGQDIMVIEKKNGIWQQRKPATFSDSCRDVDPFITHDGNKLFFSSNRPVDGKNSQKDCDFWYAEKLPSGKWSEAKHLDNPCTPGKDDFYYVSSRDGSIYYSIFEDGKGDIYYISSKQRDQTPIRLNPPINTEYNEHDPYIAPDREYLIFTSDRPGGFGSADLYICFKQVGETWSDPINMGAAINSDEYDYCAILSHDQKYLFFSSSRSGNGDVYWVDAKVIKDLKPDESE